MDNFPTIHSKASRGACPLNLVVDDAVVESSRNERWSFNSILRLRCKFLKNMLLSTRTAGTGTGSQESAAKTAAEHDYPVDLCAGVGTRNVYRQMSVQGPKIPLAVFVYR